MDTLNKGHSHYSGRCSQSQTCLLYSKTPSIRDTLTIVDIALKICLLYNSKLPQ